MNRRILPLIAALVGSVVLASPAHAQLTVTQDAKGDSVGNHHDVKKVTVQHRDKRVRFKTRMYRGSKLAHEMFHVVDTLGDRTPEFVVFTVIHNEVDPQPAVSISRVDRWPTRKDPYKAQQKGDNVDCGLMKARKRDGAKLLNVLTGRGCFKIDGDMPQRLRVNTFSTFEWGKVLDSAPGWHKYGAWVTSD